MEADTGRAHVRAYEEHALPTLQLPVDLLATSTKLDHANRQAIPGLPRNGFTVQNILSAQECDGLVKAAEGMGFQGISWEYDPTYRKCTRLVASAPSLAAELWRRLRPLLHLEDIANARPFGYGVGDNDVWRPYGVNECIRFTKYSPEDHFAIHRDGPFVLTDEERSVYTFMIYLNDYADYTGGETAFITDPEYPEGDGSKPPVVLQGNKGSAVVFEHNIWHEGRQVNRGFKYILRTDLMFVRLVATPMGPALRYADEAKYCEAERLYQESIRLQKEGDPAGSTTAYLAALDVHASLARIAPKYGPEYHLAPTAVMIEIFANLPLVTIVHCLTRVSKGWCALARHPGLWKKLYRTAFSELLPASEKPPNPLLPNKTSIKDWYTIYRTRYRAKKYFKVVYAEIGSLFFRFGMLGADARKVTTLAIAQRTSGHHWSAGSGLQHHIVGSSVLRWMDEGRVTPAIKGSKIQRHTANLLIRWMFLEGFPNRLCPMEHPLLLARSAEMTDADCTALADTARTLLGVPCVAWVHNAVCTLAALDMMTGLVFSLNRATLQVTAVHCEQVLVSEVAALTHMTKRWKSSTKSLEAVTPLADTEVQPWVQEVATGFASLAVSVLRYLDAHAPAVKAGITSTALIRGLLAREVLARVEEELSKETKGAIVKLNTAACDLFGPAFQKSIVPSTDVFLGLQRLCSSVSRAQKFFASVEPPAVKFNRPLLIWIAQDGNGYLQRYCWRRLVGRKNVAEDDMNNLTERLQVKCFSNTKELREWWNAFASQLLGAMQASLVRLCWSGDDAKDCDKTIGFKNKFGLQLPLMIWVDYDKVWPTAAVRDGPNGRQARTFWVHTFKETPGPYPDDFFFVKPGERTFALPMPYPPTP